MAKIEDLIAQIPDERLKKAIGAEVRELKRTKKFGLVFEEHLPEKHSPFAVLIQEKQFIAFREKLPERKDIEWVFLITDSEEKFSQMRRALGRKVECAQLYKSYLENFRINTQDALKG